jgi:glycoside/pentoside/hexuronide:cation symporter, GPH family
MLTPATSSSSVRRDASFLETLAYAAPGLGINFFYIPMWSILPGIYAKYFGVPLTAIATVILVIRIFDGFADTVVGFVSDWHRSRGGSRKSWVVAGCLGSIAACHFLLAPTGRVDTSYYLVWSLAYFLAYTIAIIPLTTWGSEITLDYQPRARVYATLSVFGGVGTLLFYAMPLLPHHATQEYTPEVLRESFYAGAFITVAGLMWMLAAAPTGATTPSPRRESLSLLYRSIAHNKPLLAYYAAYVFVGLAPGMWFGLVYIYVDGYLGMGEHFALMFIVGSIVGVVASGLWPKLIQLSDKQTAWAIALGLFCLQLVGAYFLRPGDPWWLALALICLAHIFFGGHNVAAFALLGDIVDYAKLRFRRDRGATYFGFYNLVFKISLGVGGASSLAIAGLFQFDPTEQTHSANAIFGLKLGFIFVPALLALCGLAFILRLPLNRRRHGIIRRRLDSLDIRSNEQEAHNVTR